MGFELRMPHNQTLMSVWGGRGRARGRRVSFRTEAMRRPRRCALLAACPLLAVTLGGCDEPGSPEAGPAPAVEAVRTFPTPAPPPGEFSPGRELEARGNEPFWSVRVEGEEAVIRTPEASEGVSYRGGPWLEAPEGGWRYRAVREGADGAGTLTLEVAEERCIDTMSGNSFPLVARLTTEGEGPLPPGLALGCAMEGRGASTDP